MGKEAADDITDQEPPNNAEIPDSDDKPGNTGKQTGVGGILPWIVTLVIAVLCAGAGLTLGRLFAAPRTPETAAPVRENPLLDPRFLGNDSPPAADSALTWYYDLEPVTVNLNEPDFARYVRVGVTLEMGANLSPSKGKAFLDQNKILLLNRLTVYLASLSTENLRGKKNLNQVRAQILEMFNKALFPHSEPRIKRILLKQLAISISLGG
jgi:flagellar basal body-associated protein FliL